MDMEEKKIGGLPVMVAPKSVTSHDGASSDFYDASQETLLTRIGLNVESFKRAPGSTRGIIAHGDIPAEYERYDNVNLQQKMKPRHIQMIAVGGAIGTGLFVGSGSALSTGGPAGILLAWIIMGFMLLNITQALGELAIMYPVAGGFFPLVSRFLDPALGAALGWNYAFQWAVTLPLELTVATSTVMYWPNNVPDAVWYTIFYIVIIIGVLFGTLGYAETEFWTSWLKLTVVTMFLIISVVCICGGGPANGAYSAYIGAKHWYTPGAFANGFKGVCSVFVTAAFSYSGSELVSFAACETPNPRATLPSAIKNIFWRIILIYLTLILLIGLAIPYDDPLLSEGTGASVSPFVVVMKKAGISGLDHLVNATVLIAVLAMGMSCVYGGSRPLMSLAEQGYAPKCFAFVDKASRPTFAILAILIWGPIAYLNLLSSGTTIFNWLIALSGLSTLFTWLAICVTHLRFRRAWRVQGHSVEELPFRALGGVYGSVVGAILVSLIIITQFYVAVWPIGEMPKGRAAAENFFMYFLSVPVLLAMYGAALVWKRTLPHRAHEIDLDTGRKSWLSVEDMRAWRAERAAQPLWKRVYHILFT